MLASRAPLLLLAPLLSFGAGALTAGVATEAARLLWVEPVTLLDAAARGDDDAIVRIVSAGEDPGAPVVLQRRVFQWRPGDTTSPLLVSIAEGKLDQAAYMIRHTQRLADPPNDQALCVAAQFGNDKITRFLTKMRAPAVPQNGCGG
jgi:hypothetical protein